MSDSRISILIELTSSRRLAVSFPVYLSACAAADKVLSWCHPVNVRIALCAPVIRNGGDYQWPRMSIVIFAGRATQCASLAIYQCHTNRTVQSRRDQTSILKPTLFTMYIALFSFYFSSSFLSIPLNNTRATPQCWPTGLFPFWVK